MRLPSQTNRYTTTINNASTSYPIYRARTMTTYSRTMINNRFLYPSQQAPLSIRAAYYNDGPAATANQPNQYHATTTMTNSNQIQQQQRGMATSSRNQRRTKNKNHKKSKRGQSQLYRNNAIAATAAAASKSNPSSTSSAKNLFKSPSALLFLGVFPVVMTGILVLVREDLREQVKDNWGIFFKKTTAGTGSGGDAGTRTKELYKEDI